MACALPEPLVIEGRATPALAEREPYLYLPFEVPPGSTRIDVTLEFDPGSIIDLGVLDPRITPFPAAAGFRGWSGGARDRFFIATDDATPGYLPGEIQVGKWQVILGLYRIAAGGCRYRVVISLDDRPRPLVPAPPPHPVFPLEAGWYPGDLQSHTHHSDARGSLGDLIQAARQRGLRFLAVTDHNTVSHHRHLAARSSEELFLLPGEEVTTDRGHANVWGARDWVDFRITSEHDPAAVVERAHQLGGLISLNHPKQGGPAWQYEVPDGVDCVEAWQAPWPTGNAESLEFYDRLLRTGRRLVLVGGSDRHQPGWPDTDPVLLQVGSPTTWLWLEELSVGGLLAALKSGRLFVSEGPQGPRLELWVGGVPMGEELSVPPAAGRAAGRDPASPSDPGRLGAVGQQREGTLAALTEAKVAVSTSEPLRLRLVGARGELASAPVGPGESTTALEVDLAAAGSFVRAELWHEPEARVKALSNPVFLVGPAS